MNVNLLPLSRLTRMIRILLLHDTILYLYLRFESINKLETHYVYDITHGPLKY